MSLRTKFNNVQLSDTGRVREHNEDAVGTNSDTGLLVLADGMGGYNAGEVASGIAVRTVLELVPAACDREARNATDPETSLMRQTIILRDAIARANRVIHQTAQMQPQCEGMGTTIVACLFYDNRVSIAHVGDSRLYRFRRNRFEQLTMDHSLLQEQLDSGLITPEEAKLSQNKNLVTKALGIDPEVEPELHVHETAEGDLYLLCSDGLNDMVEDEEIRLTLITLRSNPSLSVQQLVQAANDNGGRDNVSAMLVSVTAPFGVPRGWFARFKALFR